MKRGDLKKAEATIKQLFDAIKDTPQIARLEISWDELTQIRLDALKEENWVNAVKIALLNYLQKWTPKFNPALPSIVIDFLRDGESVPEK
jgi:hypothetical protein